MKHAEKLAGAVVLLAVLALAGLAWGQEKADYVSDKPELKAEETKYGWSPLLKFSGTLALTQSRKMVGVQDGTNVNFGFALVSGLDYLHRKGHQWSSTLDWQLNYLYTSNIDRVMKSLDQFAFQTAYLYHIPKAEYLGPFVSFTLKTSVFKGYEVRTSDTSIRKVDKDGNLMRMTFVPARENIDLTTFFAPTTLRESLGFFGDLIDEKPVKLQLRAGVGAWEIFVRDGFRVGDDAATPELELVAMEDSVQFGSEFNAIVSGLILKMVSYKLKLMIMYPFVHNVDTSLSGMDLMNVEIEYDIGVKITRWASLDYAFKAYHIPFIFDGWQIQNGLFLTLTVGIFGTEKKADG
jgi:hypothetical protein